MSWLNVDLSTQRKATVLTNALVYTTAMDVKNLNQVTALIDFVLGSLTNMLLRVQLSPDNVNWYDYETDDTQDQTIVGVDDQIPARALVRLFDGDSHMAFQVPVKAAYLRFGVIGTGTVTGSSCAISTMVGNA